MRVAIVGSRDYPHLVDVQYAIDQLKPGTVIVSGGARGVDREAANWGRMRGFTVEEHLADWKRLGKRAGPERNHLLIRDADLVLAFWDGVSAGTAHSIYLARRIYNKPISLYLKGRRA